MGLHIIRVVPDEGAERAVLLESGSSPPVERGAYFLVQAATAADGTASGDLDRFPGEVQDAADGRRYCSRSRPVQKKWSMKAFAGRALSRTSEKTSAPSRGGASASG